MRTVPDPATGLDLESELGRRIAAWEQLAPHSDEARTVYEDEVFPLVCERMRHVGRSNPTAALAVIPVGIQPYSPVLAALANPADWTVLLHTTGSRDVAETVRGLLAGELLRVTLQSCGDGTDGLAIIRAVEGTYVAAGEPDPQKVVVDITSGRKSMSAVLGALAAVRGFRQVYIEARNSAVHRTFMIEERYVRLVSVRAEVGADDRGDALALLEAGAFEPAARAFERAAATSGGAPRDRAGALASRAWLHWSLLDPARARGWLRRAHKLLDPESEEAAFLASAQETARELASADGRRGRAMRRHLAALVALEYARTGQRHALAGIGRTPEGRGLSGQSVARLREIVSETERAAGLSRSSRAKRDPYRLARQFAALLRGRR